MFRVYSLLILSLLCSTPAYAADDPSEPTEAKKFKGEGSLGFLLNRGNTENQTLRGNFKADYTGDKWLHAFELDIKQTEEQREVTGERLLLTTQSDYTFNERDYAFGAFRYDNDKFSGFSYQTSISGGVGRHFIQTETTKLNASVGLGYQENKLDSGRADDQGIVRLNEIFEQKLTKNSEFYQSLLIESGEDNTITELKLGLKVDMNSHLAVKFSYDIKENSDPPPDTESTDSSLTAFLTYSF